MKQQKRILILKIVVPAPQQSKYTLINMLNGNFHSNNHTVNLYRKLLWSFQLDLPPSYSIYDVSQKASLHDIHLLYKINIHVFLKYTSHRLVDIQGRIQDFKLGGTLKKIAPSEGRRGNFWGISCQKSRFYAKKSYFFPILGGGGACRVLPP